MTSGQLTLSDTTGTQTITGPSVGVTISGDNASRVFLVDSGVTASISGLTISGGNAPSTGVESHNYGTLTLTGTTISGNSASSNGGGLYSFRRHDHADELHDRRQHEPGQRRRLVRNNGGTLSVTDCTISGNTAAAGGGVRNYQATVTISGSTVTSNTATSDAGGILDNGMMSINQSTIANNKAALLAAGAFEPTIRLQMRWQPC